MNEVINMQIKNFFRQHITHLFAIAALLAIAIVLLTYEYHWLWKVQEQNLFLWTSLYFRQQFVVPSGLLVWLSTFFTQFLYHSWLGVLMLCGWWALLMWLLQRAFQLPRRWFSLLLVPVALLLIANVDMGYWIYVIKLRGWFFAATIGTTAVVALLWAFRCLPARRGVRQVYIAVVTAVGYPLIGVYSLAAVLLMGIWSWHLEQKRQVAVINLLVALLCVIAFPLICYRFVYYETSLANIYCVGLPIFRILDNYSDYYLPYQLLAAYFLAVVLLYKYLTMPLATVSQQHPNASKGQGVRGKGQRARVRNTHLFTYALQAVVLVGLVVGVHKAWYTDENFHHEVAMQHFVEEARWNDVLQEAAKQQDEPTRAVVMLRNIALSRLGIQGDEMYRYRGGSKRSDAPFPVQASLLVGSMVYYQYGLLNDSHRLCMEGGVEFGWRNHHLVYLTRCAMLTGDVKAMHKFTSLLKHTLYYGGWAVQMENLLRQPKLMTENKEIAPILHMLNYEDMMGTDNGFTEKYLMGILSKMDSTDPYMQEQCLLATLWAKDSKLFWKRFGRYIQQHPDDRIPRLYQEAAYLFAHKDRPQALGLPFSASVKESYNRFVKQLEPYDGQDLTEPQKLLYPLFGDTYYYDYFLMSNLTYL